MSRQKEKYSPEKMEELYEHLKIYFERGEPLDYEILVDGFKVVRRTDDPEMFDLHERFIRPDTKYIEVLIFTGASNNNDKRIFSFSEGEALSGYDVDQKIKESLAKQKRDIEFEQTKKENVLLRDELARAGEEKGKVEKELSELKAKQSPLNGFMGEIGASMLESFLKRNPKVLHALPGGQALGNLMETQDISHEEAGTEASFKPKETSELSQDDQMALAFANGVKSKFSAEEMEKIYTVLNLLAEDKKRIDKAIEILSQQPQ